MIQGEEVCSNYFFNPEKSFVTKTKTFLNDCQLPLRTLPSFQGIALTKQQKIQRMVVRSIDQKRTSLCKPPVHSRIKASPLLCEYCMTIPKAMIQLMDKILHYMGVYENVCECDKTKFSSTRRWCRILLTYRTFSPKMSWTSIWLGDERFWISSFCSSVKCFTSKAWIHPTNQGCISETKQLCEVGHFHHVASGLSPYHPGNHGKHGRLGFGEAWQLRINRYRMLHGLSGLVSLHWLSLFFGTNSFQQGKRTTKNPIVCKTHTDAIVIEVFDLFLG